MGKRQAHLSGKPRILILCESAQTEPNYFRWFKFENRLTNVVVSPLRGSKSGPRELLKRLRSELRDDPGLDEVYCVLDHDERTAEIKNFEADLARILKRRASTHIEMVLSKPCFELWLLLHFEFTDRPFASMPGGNSACSEVIKQLRRHVPEYSKNARHYLNGMGSRVSDAIANSGRLINLMNQEDHEHLSRTNVHKLVARLLKVND